MGTEDVDDSNTHVLPKNYVFYEYQVAGHHHSKVGKYEQFGLLLNVVNKHVFKQLQSASRGENESKFYDLLWNSDENNVIDEKTAKMAQKLVPKFYGQVVVEINNRPMKFLELENLCGNFKKPCVTDIKIGRKVRGPKSVSEGTPNERKYDWAKELCFRFCGMIVYITKADMHQTYSKEWIASLKAAGTMTVFSVFFQKDERLSKNVLKVVQKKLQDIQTFLDKQRFFAFYATSILISYEGCVEHRDDQANEELCEKFVDVRMIDFSHTKIGNDRPDYNYIEGLNKFLLYLQKYIDSLSY